MKHIIYKDDKMLGSYLAGLWPLPGFQLLTVT
jgi:hypothetical protein